MKGTKTPAPTPPEPMRIHTPLTTDDRDAFDVLRGRIERNATLLALSLAKYNDDDDLFELPELDKTTVEAALIELSMAIVTDARGLRAVLDTAEQRKGETS
jgi:hypothetical protein